MKEKMKSLFFKIWYWYISSVDKNAEVIFMNYGYSNEEEELKLNEKDKKNRYSIQLYNLVAAGTNIAEKDLLEVGCGRGGGLSYINQNLLPKNVTGIDLNKKAIQFCNKFYKESNSTFMQANAQKLPFKDNSFDVVLNVESSHRYPQPEVFFKEVYRVLKPGGYFLFSDFRFDYEIEETESQLKKAGLQMEKKQDITPNVVKALESATPDREILIKKIVPKLLQNLAGQFAAIVGTPTYNKFLTRKFIYFNYVLKK
ncbi:MAG: class I SAM-dependent methyltransferase [Chlorobi bacterium]|nr:class I SAM-dependent methyltransferase [Chlorobiota bacterium]